MTSLTLLKIATVVVTLVYLSACFYVQVYARRSRPDLAKAFTGNQILVSWRVFVFILTEPLRNMPDAALRRATLIARATFAAALALLPIINSAPPQ